MTVAHVRREGFQDVRSNWTKLTDEQGTRIAAMDTLEMLFQVDRVEERFDAKRAFTIVDGLLVCVPHVFCQFCCGCEVSLAIRAHLTIVTVDG